ncbi:MAG TPA: tRNA (adenosine(37)-N6)-threonylcarbamoyltransferase complex dimerization subunit type 1 TsaB [Candidatus Omnitrophota bacterium]|nr:tRNA (adenosine(37)-N6)-threonylcarbamoyltransferase complex dimerization subunit type 1 TsaB [Candidatus Omnitrophota bacterium]
MATLGISSATKTISVGLSADGRLLAELTVSGKQAFTEDLAVYVQKIVNESGAKIDGIAAISGPGAYSGLRGGLAFAKTFAQVNKVPLAAVSTLHALACNLIGSGCLIAAVTDAAQDDRNFALFRPRAGEAERLTGDLVVSIEKICSLLSRIKGEVGITGNCDDIMAKVAELNPGTKIRHDRLNVPSGFNVAAIGEKMIKEGKVSDPLKLAPTYSRNPVIKEFRT